MFDRIGPKTQNFVLANINYTHCQTLEFVDPLPRPRPNRKYFGPSPQIDVKQEVGYVRIYVYICGSHR